MSHTNETANYDLPQFVGSDKPTWLGDVNGAFAAIDAAIAGVASAATDAASVASNAADVAAAATTTANAASTTASAASTAATTATTTANNAADTANNAQSTAVLAKNTADDAASAVGDLTTLETTAKTSAVAAINEVNAKADRGSVSVTADGVKTIAQLLSELHTAADLSKITPYAKIVDESTSNSFTVYNVHWTSSSSALFTYSEVTSSTRHLMTMVLSATGARYDDYNGTITDYSSSVLGDGHVIKLYY